MVSVVPLQDANNTFPKSFFSDEQEANDSMTQLLDKVREQLGLAVRNDDDAKNSSDNKQSEKPVSQD